MNSELYLGIDFGTSTNYITRWDKNKKEAVPVENLTRDYSGLMFDNVIYYESLTNHIIGRTAFKKGIEEPMKVVEGIKRKIEEDNWTQRIVSLNKEVNAVEVATDIFREIKKRIESNFGGTSIDGAVISVPFSFQNRERQRIKQAAKDAGLNVLQLIEEPVAAAISYGLFGSAFQHNKKEKILIFDLGGGTFDVTIFELERKDKHAIRVEVLNTAGQKNLGGTDIDHLLIEKFEGWIDGYKLENIPDERQRRKDYIKLIECARQLKENLSEMEEDEVFVPQLYMEKVLDKEDIKRVEFNQWLRSRGFLSKIRQVLEEALFEIDLEPEDIGKIILVGGASNIPAVQQLVFDVFKKPSEAVKNPGKLVGEGAGIYCGSLNDKNLQYEIIRAVSHAIGIKVGRRFEPFIRRNSKYATFSDIRFRGIRPRGERSKIPVYQGNSADIEACSPVGEIVVDTRDITENRIGIALGTDDSGIVKYRLYRKHEHTHFKEGEFSDE